MIVINEFRKMWKKADIFSIFFWNDNKTTINLKKISVQDRGQQWAFVSVARNVPVSVIH
jgi:hypothetical protein